jgi:hypothetical protein
LARASGALPVVYWFQVSVAGFYFPPVAGKGGEWYFSPKTERSDHEIIVSESLRLLLVEHHRKQFP